MTTRIVNPGGNADAQLERAASLLAGVGYADPAAVDPGVALLCLAGAEQLGALVGHPPRTAVNGVHVRQAVDDVLASLAALPEEVFAAEAVLEAAAYARAARALLS